MSQAPSSTPPTSVATSSLPSPSSIKPTSDKNDSNIREEVVHPRFKDTPTRVSNAKNDDINTKQVDRSNTKNKTIVRLYHTKLKGYLGCAFWHYIPMLVKEGGAEKFQLVDVVDGNGV
jgi:hypothetical protein